MLGGGRHKSRPEIDRGLRTQSAEYRMSRRPRPSRGRCGRQYSLSPRERKKSFPPVLGFEEKAVVVEGLARATDGVVFGVARGLGGFLPYELDIAQRTTADAQGSLRVELQWAMPQ